MKKLTDKQWKQIINFLNQSYGNINNINIPIFIKKIKAWKIWFSDFDGTQSCIFNFHNGEITWFDGEGWRIGSVYELKYL